MAHPYLCRQVLLSQNEIGVFVTAPATGRPNAPVGVKPVLIMAGLAIIGC